ncbi:hypothetical protein L2E82_13802 [Cichorium intybus]|uniref:Uncharacterized protein n=1 Tax=Cichorium intybus TaxID=13427 RepID=A0ACB9EYV0_CICIN|nr:hypothetical protein L2E82_13802 [Cichorium intybus]
MYQFFMLLQFESLKLALDFKNSATDAWRTWFKYLKFWTLNVCGNDEDDEVGIIQADSEAEWDAVIDNHDSDDGDSVGDLQILKDGMPIDKKRGHSLTSRRPLELVAMDESTSIESSSSVLLTMCNIFQNPKPALI